jgi:hypothetical protein
MRNSLFSFHSTQLNPPLPDCDYKGLIVEGARHWQLPIDYIRQLEAIQNGEWQGC